MKDDILNRMLFVLSLQVFLYEYNFEATLPRRLEGSVATIQEASLGKDVVEADGKTMMGEANANAAHTAMLTDVYIVEYAAAIQSTLA